jgi:hypothetical protein
MFSIPFLILTIASSDVLCFSDAAPSFRFQEKPEPVATLPTGYSAYVRQVCVYVSVCVLLLLLLCVFNSPLYNLAVSGTL